MRIYTKTGDEGTTGLVGGQRVSKADVRIEAVGTVDELNSFVGKARLSKSPLSDGRLAQIQNWLFDCGAELACPPGGKFSIESITTGHIAALEEDIDAFTANLPELRNFILPGGSPLAADLHVCRSVCRRAERSVIQLRQADHVRDELLQFLNRLSDWFFVAARTANAESGVEDVIWKQESL